MRLRRSEAPEGVEHAAARERRVEPELTGQVADLGEGAHAVAGDVVAHDRHPAGGRADEPQREADERRLAGAVRPEEPEALAPPDPEVDALDADRPPVHPRQGRGLDGVVH
jgi:hypothetical protein